MGVYNSRCGPSWKNGSLKFLRHHQGAFDMQVTINETWDKKFSLYVECASALVLFPHPYDHTILYGDISLKPFSRKNVKPSGSAQNKVTRDFSSSGVNAPLQICF